MPLSASIREKDISHHSSSVASAAVAAAASRVSLSPPMGSSKPNNNKDTTMPQLNDDLQQQVENCDDTSPIAITTTNVASNKNSPVPDETSAQDCTDRTSGGVCRSRGNDDGDSENERDSGNNFIRIDGNNSSALATTLQLQNSYFGRRRSSTAATDDADEQNTMHSHDQKNHIDKEIDSEFILPKSKIPPRNEMEPIEVFVANAVQEQHHQQQQGSKGSQQPIMLVQNYKVIIDAFRLKKDMNMMYKLLIALRTSGSTLSLLVSDSTIHARLIHNIVRFVPFPSTTIITNTTITTQTSYNQNPRQSESGDDCDISQIEFDTSLADAQFHFLTALISANTVFLVPTLTALWKMLTVGVLQSHPIRTLRIHATLATITRLCPKAKTELFPIIQGNTPFRMKKQEEILFYYRQCLTVLQYIPHIRQPILDLIIHRCLEVDVDIQITDHGEATIDLRESTSSGGGRMVDDQNNNTEGMFQLDMDDDNNDLPSRDTTTTDTMIVSSTDVTVDETADKLDSLLLLVFQYIESIILENSHGPATTSATHDEVFQMVSRVFESAILITHKSKFVQFVVFHICGIQLQLQQQEEGLQPRSNNLTDDGAITSLDSAQPDLPSATTATTTLLFREFASNLIHILVDPYRATVTRQSAACYLASFVSRANYVCTETVRESIDALLRWAEAYVESLVSSSSSSVSIHAPDVREQCSMHSLFYTVCQAAFYVMCFRGVEVVRYMRTSSESKGLQEMIDLGTTRWTKLCSHPLVPLRYCLESVRTEFLRISKLFSLLDKDVLHLLLDTEILHNSPQRKKKTSNAISTPATLEKERLRGGVGGLGRGTNPLDSFFPFDPYLLRRSHIFIEPYYKHWDGGLSADSYVLDENDEDEDDTAIIVDGESEDDSTQRVHGYDDDDSISDSDDDEEDTHVGDETITAEESNNVVRRKRLMSFASNATSVSSRPSSVEDRNDDFLVSTKRDEMKKAWSTIIKRPRAPSCSENGSW